MTVQRSDSRISVLLHIQQQDAAAINQLLAQISKGKTDADVVCIADEKRINEINDQPAAKELAQKEKWATALSVADAFTKATGTLAVYLAQTEHINIASLLSQINTRKKKLNNDTFYFGNYWHKESNNKQGFFAKFANSCYNGFFRFISTSNISDHKSGVMVCHTNYAEQVFTQQVSTAANYIEIAHQISSLGLAVDDFVLTSEKQVRGGSLFSVFALPFISLWLSIKFFIPAALAEMKHKLTYTNKGNAPIYRLVFFVLAAGISVMYPMLSQDFGMTWDEKQHNEYSKLTYSWFTTLGEDSAALADSKDASDYIRQAYRFYGEQMNLVAAFVYNTFDTDPFATRHFINSLYGLLGVLAVALTLKALTSWRGAIIALLFMAFNPGWMGFSMNNPTDIPFAVGFAVSGLFMVKILQRLPAPKQKHITWLGVGIGIGIGSRIGALLIIAFMGLFMGIQYLAKMRAEKLGFINTYFKPYLFTFLKISGLGYLFGIILWPYGLSNPFKNPIAAYTKASENAFYTNNTELFEGKRMYMLTEAPGYYVVKFLGMGNPIYLLVGMALSVLLLNWIRKYVNIGYVLMFIFMVVFPVAYAEYSNINYYNGWRHYMFLVPAMVITASLAYDFLLHSAKNTAVQTGVFALIAAGFAKPFYWIVKNHPNQYVYFNELVGGINGAYGNYETDYYSNSCREAAEWLANHLPAGSKAKIGINNEPLTASHYAHQINPNLEFFWVREYEEYKPRWDYLILTTRTFSKNELLNGAFPPKGTIYKVMADDVPLCVVIKRENTFMPDGYEAIQRKSADTAIMHFTKACEYDPMNEESFRMLATAYMMAGRFDEAQKAAEKSIQIYPENYSSYSLLGQMWYNREKPDSALPYLDKALFYKRNVTEAYFYAGQSHMMKNNFGEAAKYFENGLTHNGSVPEMYYGLGTAYLNLGSFSKAEDALSAALSLNPNYAPAYYMLAQVFQRTNEMDKANECMRRYQRLSAGLPIN
ncbi:MAG: tetratricopeptide repeat protein [Bacteroidota bacterium]